MVYNLRPSKSNQVNIKLTANNQKKESKKIYTNCCINQSWIFKKAAWQRFGCYMDTFTYMLDIQEYHNFKERKQYGIRIKLRPIETGSEIAVYTGKKD